MSADSANLLDTNTGNGSRNMAAVDYQLEMDAVLSTATTTVASIGSCEWFTFSIYVVVMGGLCIFGLVGNTLSFVVLRAERHSHVATFLLQTMAVADNLFLITTALSQMTIALTVFYENVAASTGHIDPDHLYNSYAIMAYVKVFVWPLVHICQMWTVWITVLVAFNRYIAICLPFRATRLCTMRQARIQVICLAVIISLYNVPRFLELRLEKAPLYDESPPDGFGVAAAFPDDLNVTSSTVTALFTEEQTHQRHPNQVMVPYAEETSLKSNRAYNIAYENVLYCFFVFLGPLIILAILNACLIRELYLARRRLRERHLPPSVSGPEQGEQNLTLVMIVIVLVFVVCQTPAFINQLLFVVGVTDSCGEPYFYFYHLSNVLVTANSAFNFVVYCVFRRHFRRRLRVFLRCGPRRSPTDRRGSDGSLLQPWQTETHLYTEQYVGLRASSVCNSLGNGNGNGGYRNGNGRTSMVSMKPLSSQSSAPVGGAPVEVSPAKVSDHGSKAGKPAVALTTTAESPSL